MTTPSGPALSPRAGAALRLLALAALALAAVRPVPDTARVTHTTRGDVAAFRAILANLRTGGDYYSTFGAVLRREGFPTRDAFNWRTPLHLTALAAVPEPVARGALLTLMSALCVATLATVRRPIVTAWTATLLQTGMLALAVDPAALVVSEVWAGALIGLSVCAYVGRRPALGLGLGLAALLTRELAAPYCLVCALTATTARRWREAAGWAAGAIGYAAYYAWHLVQVAAHRLPTDLTHPASWLQLGGLPFLLSTLHWLGWLAVLPAPLAAVVLTLLAAGLVSQNTPAPVRVAGLAYVIFFLVAGHPFNHYWGLVAGPAWAIACGYGITEIWRAVATLAHGTAPSRIGGRSAGLSTEP